MEQVGVLTSLIFQMFVLNVVSYNLKCPSQANWKLRAQVKCNSTLKYFCLYNSVIWQYVEGCNGPDWDRKGSKRIFAGDFSRGYCIKQRFQPFVFWTNDSVSDCIYAKSICSEKGQVVYKDNSSTDDRVCGCDYKKSYSFIQKPRNNCYCIPTEEECSCYIKSCPENYTLSADYRCKTYDSKEITKCLDINKNNKTSDEKHEVCKDDDYLCSSKTIFKLKRNKTAQAIICICIIVIIVSGGLFVAVLRSQNLPPLNRYCHKSQKDYVEIEVWEKQLDEKVAQTSRIDHDEMKVGKILVDEKVTQTSTIDDDELNVGEIQLNEKATQTSTIYYGEMKVGKILLDKKVTQTSTIDGLTRDEVYFLRIIHLLFRVACPVVRITFNHGFQPNQLRKTLDRKKALLSKLNSRTDKFINDVQWSLLFKGKTVKSEDFDISLMIYILQTLANIKVCDLYPLPTDTSTSAMLSRIKYIRNETTQNLNGKLTEDQFNQYWDDIGQAILKLASSHTFAIENDQEDIRLIGRLISLNPVIINNKHLCTFIDVSEKYPAMILQTFISEYCILKQLTIDDVLTEEKHRLYHKRLKTVSCCQCTTEFHTYSKCIPEKHWEALYELTEVGNSHNCKCELKLCIELFVPKRNITFDIFVAETIILYIPNIFKYFLSRLCVKGFDIFLMQNKHTLYHCMDKKKCCKCDNVPTGKIFMNETEWNTLFIKEDTIYCKTGSEYCCCQYAVRNFIEYSDVDDTLLSKMFSAVGPFGVFNKIEQDPFLYFLNWTAGDQRLEGALNELVNMIEDTQFVRNIRSSISSQSGETITNQFDARKWISKHLRQQQATTEHQRQILVRDEDGLKVKSVDIPEDFPLPRVPEKFNDLTPEENNFLLVFYWLTNIVHPVIKNVFDTKCPDPVLHKICIEIFQANKQPPAKNYNDDDNRKKKRIYLTESQMRQLFSANSKQRKNIDLELMIYILKQISKETDNTEKLVDAYYLDVVDTIRREIMQSSSGVLNETRFHEIFNCILQAVLHFGGEMYVEKILQLRHVSSHILE